MDQAIEAEGAGTAGALRRCGAAAGSYRRVIRGLSFAATAIGHIDRRTIGGACFVALPALHRPGPRLAATRVGRDPLSSPETLA